jgi:transcriptional regulator with XRE-family HTH domain
MSKLRRELTDTEKEAAKRLMRLFTAYKKAQNLTQTKLANRIGMSQSAVGQYLNGEIPLNLPALISFSQEFGCTIQDIDPTCPHIIPTSPEEKALIAAYRDMDYRHDQASKRALLQVAELSGAYRVTLEHNAKKEPADPDS